MLLKVKEMLTMYILFRLRNSPDSGGNVEPIPAGEQSNPSAADNSLAGDREHGLPNNTKSEEQPVVNILEILKNIHKENTDQVRGCTEILPGIGSVFYSIKGLYLVFIVTLLDLERNFYSYYSTFRTNILVFQVIYNDELFGPVSNSTVIIAVQVHNRLTY